jgi:hypothetical protein
MRGVRCRGARLATLLAVACASCASPSALTEKVAEVAGVGTPAVPVGPPDVARVAHEIDCLEQHIDKYGSIVPKQADVWGESRLMMHRQEYELVMKGNLGKFEDTLQASIARSDQAFLASAFALQAAVGPRGGRGATTSETNVSLTQQGNDGTGAVAAPDASSLIVTKDDGVTRTAPRATRAVDAAFKAAPLSLEPTLKLDQQSRYLKHLHVLRRINEGDDNTDAPGYSLNLVRIPVSVLTGSCTDTGFGAELTVTATPYLTDDLLPTTFRNLVINDLVDQFTMPVTQLIDTTDRRELEALTLTRSLVRSTAPAPAVSRRVGSAVGAAGPPNRAQMIATYTDQRDAYAARVAEKKQGAIRPAGSPRRVSQLPVPPSQFLTVFGYRQLTDILAEVYISVKNHLSDGRHPYHLDVQAVLGEELKGAYSFLAAESNAHLWRFASPALVQAIRGRDDDLTRRTREEFFGEVARAGATGDDPQGELAKSSVTAALAWAIVVESALLNDRLIRDMKATHAAKGCPCVPEGGLPFFLPDPPEEARKVFNDYVRCRWPLYVFAVDPQAEDQNVADAFSLRRELQLAMSLAFTSGRIGANQMTRYVRRLEEEIETIAINRTVVGFSHGSDTFGWRFYPRVQTPPIDGNAQAIFRDLLVGARRPEYYLRNRRLENGPRECVALVVMPSFIPHVTLDYTANWFRLASPKCKELTLKDAMRLSQSVKSLREQAQGLCDEHRYREGDAALLARKLEQLSARLPLQSQLVNVPFENTSGGFELFAAGTTDLAPELIGWYGGPGIVPDGKTSLFLVGDHFSVHQTRVVVGGVSLSSDVADPLATPAVSPSGLQVELLSRQVLRVTVPGGCQPKNGFIDIHVATPYGVSASLAVPVVGGTPPAAAAAAGYSLAADANAVRIRYTLEDVNKDGTMFRPRLRGTPAGGIRINWAEPTGSALKQVEVRLNFNVDGSTFSLVRTLTAANGSFDIVDGGAGDAGVGKFAEDLLKKLEVFHPTPAKLLASQLETTSVEIKPVSPPYADANGAVPPGSPTHAVRRLSLAEPIRVELQHVIP